MCGLTGGINIFQYVAMQCGTIRCIIICKINGCTLVLMLPSILAALCVTDAIKVCVEDSILSRKVRCFPNNKPWIASDLEDPLNKTKNKKPSS